MASNEQYCSRATWRSDHGRWRKLHVQADNRSADSRLVPGGIHSLLRVVTGALFMQHGVEKLFGLLLSPDRPWNGAPEAFSRMWFAGVLEVFGGALIVLGLLTRPVAFLLSGEMAVAYFQTHFPRDFWPILNGGEHVVLFCFVFLYLFAAGPGPYSVDAALFARRRSDRTVRDRAVAGRQSRDLTAYNT